MRQRFSKFIIISMVIVAAFSLGSRAFADDDSDFKKAFRDLEGKPAVSTELTDEQKAILARAAAKKAALAEAAALAKAQKAAHDQELADHIRQKAEADKIARAKKAEEAAQKLANAKAEKVAAAQREKEAREARLKEQKAQALQRQAEAKAQAEEKRAELNAKQAEAIKGDSGTQAMASTNATANPKTTAIGLKAISKIRATENRANGIPGPNGRYTVKSGDDLQAVLTRWANQSGWTVQWKSDYAFAIVGNAGFGPEFKSAVQGLIDAMQEARPAPAVDLYPDNKMVVVLDGLTAVR